MNNLKVGDVAILAMSDDSDDNLYVIINDPFIPQEPMCVVTQINNPFEIKPASFVPKECIVKVLGNVSLFTPMTDVIKKYVPIEENKALKCYSVLLFMTEKEFDGGSEDKLIYTGSHEAYTMDEVLKWKEESHSSITHIISGDNYQDLMNNKEYVIDNRNSMAFHS